MANQMDRGAFIGATLAGTAAQLIMVITGHFVPFVADNLFAILGVAISAVAGLLYARRAPQGRPLLFGTVAGAVCATIGLAVSAMLGDVPAMIVPFAALASAVGGAAGALVARKLFGRRSGSASATP